MPVFLHRLIFALIIICLYCIVMQLCFGKIFTGFKHKAENKKQKFANMLLVVFWLMLFSIAAMFAVKKHIYLNPYGFIFMFFSIQQFLNYLFERKRNEPEPVYRESLVGACFMLFTAIFVVIYK